jgi:hypothetical protein
MINKTGLYPCGYHPERKSNGGKSPLVGHPEQPEGSAFPQVEEEGAGGMALGDSRS